VANETSVDCQRATWSYTPEDGTLHNHRCENIKSYLILSPTEIPSWTPILKNMEQQNKPEEIRLINVSLAVTAGLFSATQPIMPSCLGGGGGENETDTVMTGI
jgi:hypothetical protein